MQISGFKVGEPWWNRAALAGLAGGTAMALYQMIISAAMGHGLWRPLNLIGGVIPYFRPPAPGLAAPGFWPGTTVGAALHLMMSMGWGLLYGVMVAAIAAYFAPPIARSWFFGLFVGLGWGVVSYVAMGMIVGPALDPALNWVDGYPFFVAHVVFGLVTALTFTALVRQPRVTVTFAPDAAAVERTPSGRGR
ncbi:MAG: conserved hypothetical rane spanning protein [Cyanobacteria bacterium RYN_339]|nr:conserved hypothetical rane spanning protein [Cyanobacteria bacterium RYN_339]